MVSRLCQKSNFVKHIPEIFEISGMFNAEKIVLTQSRSLWDLSKVMPMKIF